ncbi:pilus assembly protein TadG-related protein [Paraburkholderia bonniea]|uniref:TadG family pilus assembly protein n=1 Tax=Paraburkholderia bonniea TaxID=2152891 RepID=UPI0025735D7B|nr:TadG family pilus assembly protein [Paraburkholderia bonniea]WJF91289.1 pilus assembly protein TadG-related protein [Paraburkholderia bonniea]WJF94604.1 pilus assembly protein TadG-related protein [Paraburkholderia bonniea]
MPLSTDDSSHLSAAAAALHVRGATRCRPARQRGAIAVLAAVWIGLAVVALAALDVGNAFLMRRQLQRTADMAALAGAQSIGVAAGCATATAAAQGSARANGLPAAPRASLSVSCGRWDPTVNAGASYFSTTGAPQNAVQVKVSQNLPYLYLGPARLVQAQASAKASNIGAFSLTTTLASASPALLNGLLNGLLNTSLNLSLASYQGLAQTQVKLLDLAAALGVGSMSQLLNTQVSIAQLANAMVTAVSQSSVASASVATDLGTIAAAVPGGPKISLGDSSSANGLLAISLADQQAAANATISALDALLVAAEIAHGSSAVNLGLGINLGPLVTLTAQAKVLEPPVLAVGEAGRAPDGTWRTSAHSAQVRVFLNVALLKGVSLLGLANLTALNLPIYIEAGQGTAYLQSLRCTTHPATSQSVIVAQPGIAALCVGADAASNFANTTGSTTCQKPVTLTSASLLFSLLGLVNISVGSTSPPSGLNLSLQAAAPTTLGFNGIAGDSDDYQSTNTNGAGSATAGLLTQLVSALPGSLHATLLGGLDVTALVAPVLSAVVSLLSPILISLDALLVPLLQLLGVQIGISTVHDSGLSCGQAQLVY